MEAKKSELIHQVKQCLPSEPIEREAESVRDGRTTKSGLITFGSTHSHVINYTHGFSVDINYRSHVNNRHSSDGDYKLYLSITKETPITKEDGE